jgi:hypothetical protein
MLGAILAALATFWAGTALFSRRAAFIAAVVLGTTLLLTTEANIAKTDAAQCGILALGMGALAQMRAGLGGKWHGVLFWVCLSFGILLKGPIAPLVCLSAIAALFLWERKFEWARPLLYWMGLSLFCVLTIPWYIAVQIATNGEFLSEAVRVDLGQKLVDAAEGHAGPFGMHTAALPLLFWPGTLLLIPGIWMAISRLLPAKKTKATEGLGRVANDAAAEREAAAWRFLVCWIVPSWLVFEIAPTKLVHYTLPLYPAFALMAGAAADHWFSTNSWKFGRWISAGLFVLVALLLAIVPTPPVLEQLRGEAAQDFGDLTARVSHVWDQAWAATGIGIWPTLLILAATGGRGGHRLSRADPAEPVMDAVDRRIALGAARGVRPARGHSGVARVRLRGAGAEENPRDRVCRAQPGVRTWQQDRPAAGFDCRDPHHRRGQPPGLADQYRRRGRPRSAGDACEASNGG